MLINNVDWRGESVVGPMLLLPILYDGKYRFWNYVIILCLNKYNAMNIIFCMGENVWSDGIWIKSPVAVNKWKFVYWIYSIYYVLTFKFSSEKIRITLSFKIKTNSYLSCSCFCTILSLSLSSGNWPPFFTILHDWKKLWSFNITCVTPKCYLMCFV